jgi:cyclic-di-GMP-binding biofilm dispersal mediator protein
MHLTEDFFAVGPPRRAPYPVGQSDREVGMERLDGARFLVTGASGGLGAPIARRLAAAGASLTLVARDPARLDAVDVPGERLALDLRVPEACATAVAEAAGPEGRLGGVVNAVGVVAFGNVEDLEPDVMEELFLTNTFVPMMLARAALPHLAEGGVIVNLSGVVAERSFPGMAAYAASKSAIRAFDEGLAAEVRRRRIRVIDARPPHTETGLADRPIAGTAPRFPEGLAPDDVAARIVEAILGDEKDLPSDAFGGGR